MGKFCEDSVKWFVEALKHSASSNDYIEIANGELQMESVSKLLIKSNIASIKVSFSVDKPSYSVLSHQMREMFLSMAAMQKKHPLSLNPGILS